MGIPAILFLPFAILTHQKLKSPLHSSTVMNGRNDLSSLSLCLMVEPSPFTYMCGYSNRFQEMLRFLDEQGDEVEVITSDVTIPESERPKVWGRHRIHHTGGFRLPLYRAVTLSMDYRLKALRLLHRMRPDFIHVSTPGFMAFPAIVYSRMFNTVLVMSYHTHIPIYVRMYLKSFPWTEKVVWWLIRCGHWFADLTLVTSPQIKQEFDLHGVKKVEVWKKGIDTGRFHPKYSSPEWRDRMTAGNPDDFLVVYVGRFAAEKRVMDCKAVLNASPPDTRICFVGMGPQEDELKEAFSERRAVFTGQLRGEALSSAYATADVLIMPSDSETLGFVVLEAMASGTPVVAARAGGIPDMIQDGVTSFLVTPGNVAEYVDRLQQLRNETIRHKMGQMARAEAEKWNWNSSMRHLRNVQYEQARLNFQQRWSTRLWHWLFRSRGCSDTTDRGSNNKHS